MPQQLWTDTYLDQVLTDAAEWINDAVNCLYFKMYVPITTQVPIITLDPLVKKVLRVTWRGWKLEAISWDDLLALSPATAIVTPTDQVNTAIGRPQWYAMHPTNLYDIRLFPTPNESFDNTGDPYSPTVNESKCCVSGWRNIDLTTPLGSLPTYIDRRTRKAYAAWRAFEKEGRGQSANAAMYYKKKYDFLEEQFRMINSGCFVSRKFQMGSDEIPTQELMRYPKPWLPANFERVIY